MGAQERVSLSHLKILAHHLLTHLLHGDLRNPTKFILRFSRISKQRLDLSWPEIARIDPHNNVTYLQCWRLITAYRCYNTNLVDSLTFEAK